MTSYRTPNGNSTTHEANGNRTHSTDASAHQNAESAAANEPNPVAPLLAHLAEMREYLTLYLATQADSVKLGVRQALVKAALGVIGLIAVVAVVATAGVLLVTGLANGLAVLLGDRLWAGQIITAVTILSVLAGSAYAGVQGLLNSSRKRTVEKYERRHQQQRAAFGHDVRQRAQQPSQQPAQ